MNLNEQRQILETYKNHPLMLKATAGVINMKECIFMINLDGVEFKFDKAQPMKKFFKDYDKQKIRFEKEKKKENSKKK